MREHERERVTGRRLLAAAAAAALALGAGTATEDPTWSVPEADLAAALTCPDTFASDHQPVLLVHGTGGTAAGNFGWNQLPALERRGFDVCTVDYPDRGFGDQQVAAEYVAHAVIEIHESSGRQVDLVGHSQGGSMPRWALKFWPSARDAVDDHVAYAAPHHGTVVAGSAQNPGGVVRRSAAYYQFAMDSNFVRILDDGDETPGDVDWTNLFSDADELVQPSRPDPVAALEHGQDNPRVANLRLQDLCPGRAVDHLTIGTTDRLAFELMLDAIVHDGPADPARLDLPLLCLDTTPVAEGDPDPYLAMLEEGRERGFPDRHESEQEPETADYAR